MSFTKENFEIQVSPECGFVHEGSKVNAKIFLLAGAHEATKNALTDFFETVESAVFKLAVKDLLLTEIRLLSKTGHLNLCKMSELTEPFNVKVVFVSSSFRSISYTGTNQPSLEFSVLLMETEPITPPSSPELNSNDSCWNFNTLERVRETSEDI